MNNRSKSLLPAGRIFIIECLSWKERHNPVVSQMITEAVNHANAGKIALINIQKVIWPTEVRTHLMQREMLEELIAGNVADQKAHVNIEWKFNLEHKGYTFVLKPEQPEQTTPVVEPATDAAEGPLEDRFGEDLDVSMEHLDDFEVVYEAPSPPPTTLTIQEPPRHFEPIVIDIDGTDPDEDTSPGKPMPQTIDLAMTDDMVEAVERIVHTTVG